MTRIEVIYVELPELIESNLLHNSLSLLSSNERDLYDRCLPKRKIEFLTGRVLLKKKLANYLECSPHEIIFMKNKYGKLFLATDASVHFNLSHSENIVVAAFCITKDIGIDVEYVWKNHLDIMPYVFVREEVDWVKQHENLNDQMQAFSYIWTRKEAVMKALGKGFSHSPLSFKVPIEMGDSKDNTWYYTTFSILDKYLISIVQTIQPEEKIDISKKCLSFENLYELDVL
ncbi:4'-phosphopantetheinyl transferase superfamily protein [Bacillus cereus group sp. N34]|uniref:4'-phosphopantetheinyl transferase family protein n=1 Tax=Bacillus cereus group sp. N34 TaxID=2794595 RepID=UPI0018F5E58D|nr:4'-phosphopantetheinyl transferase superfamily protein [Bacillus cereus group sp. N34]MBJ8015089.1 4'-phosphopantetheinyl transferase superfamily protein [Bacillus cereus group sp. N34]